MQQQTQPIRRTQQQRDHIHGNVKRDDNMGSRWLKARGSDIKGMGVGYTLDVKQDRSKIRTLQHALNEAAMRGDPTDAKGKARAALRSLNTAKVCRK